MYFILLFQFFLARTLLRHRLFHHTWSWMSLPGVINFGFIYFSLIELHLMFKKKSTWLLLSLCSLRISSASLSCSSIFFRLHFLNSLQVWLSCPSFPLLHCPGSFFSHEFWHFSYELTPSGTLSGGNFWCLIRSCAFLERILIHF